MAPKTPETVRVAVLRPIRVAGQGDSGHCEPGTIVKLPFAEGRYLHHCQKVHCAWAKDKPEKKQEEELKQAAQDAAPRKPAKKPAAQ